MKTFVPDIARTLICGLLAAMTPEALFTAALGLGPQWRVAECRFEGEPKGLELRLEHVPGEPFECPVCQARCGVHDTIERRWRHWDFFQYHCELRFPRFAGQRFWV
jgi:transposase